MCLNSIDFRRGGRFPGLVLLGACPGQDEWNATPRRPFAGQSAVNLRILLQALHDLQNKEAYGFQPDDFSSTNPDDYTLMNSHDEAKWWAKDRRTTPRLSEVQTPANLRRLTDQLLSVDARVVVGLGRPIDDAKLVLGRSDTGPLRAIRRLAPGHPHISFCVTGHPSPQAINAHGGGDPRRWFVERLSRFELG